MAIYHLSVKPVTRADGRSATAAAAYRSAGVIHDRTSGETFDYTRKRGVEHTEIVLPTSAVKRDINWARNREDLWNAAEAAEKRSNSRVAREYEIALPQEMNRKQRVELVREFSKEIADRYGVAVDFALHAPHRKGDDRNYHAHVLTTTRTVEAKGLGDKARLEWSDTNRAKAGLGPAKEDITQIRERWAALTNERLEEIGKSARVDHRTLEAQGIEREPTHHQGPAISGILDRGERSTVADRWVQEANERLRQAKELGELEREHAKVSGQVIDLSSDLAATLRERDQAKHQILRPAEQREQARADWLEMREGAGKAARRDSSQRLDTGASKEVDKAKDKGHSRDGPDDDFSL